MARVLVLFYSRTGNTARLADAIVEGARSVRFAEVDVRRLDDVAPAETIEADPAWRESREQLRARYRTLEDVSVVADYDALILGSPTRYGVMGAELQHFFDRLGPLWSRGALVDTVGSAFTSVQAGHGGTDLALMSILTPMCTLGMILAPPGHLDPATYPGGSPFGATAVVGADGPGADDLATARHQGARVARIAEWVRHAKGHEHGAQGHPHHHHHH